MKRAELIGCRCHCGFVLGIPRGSFEEVDSGVWGCVNCPKCSKLMFPRHLIKDPEERPTIEGDEKVGQ